MAENNDARTVAKAMIVGSLVPIFMANSGNTDAAVNHFERILDAELDKLIAAERERCAKIVCVRCRMGEPRQDESLRSVSIAEAERDANRAGWNCAETALAQAVKRFSSAEDALQDVLNEVGPCNDEGRCAGHSVSLPRLPCPFGEARKLLEAR